MSLPFRRIFKPSMCKLSLGQGNWTVKLARAKPTHPSPPAPAQYVRTFTSLSLSLSLVASPSRCFVAPPRSSAASPLVSWAVAAEALTGASLLPSPPSSKPASCLPRPPLPRRLLRLQLPATTRRRRTESSPRSPMVMQVPGSASPSTAPGSTTPQVRSVRLFSFTSHWCLGLGFLII